MAFQCRLRKSWKMMIILLVLEAALNGVGALGGNKLEVVYAVNAGGDKYQDSDGIVYQKDPSNDGIASDFGLRLDIQRVNQHDAVLYQTERYSHSSFGYDIPIKQDGSYVLVVKFAEVYFRHPGEKVFDVVLNKIHLVAHELDIFANVGFATAHDEIVPFTVSGNGKKLTVGEHSSDVVRGKVRLDFMKGLSDNPKVNAFYVVKGTVEDIPHLPQPEPEWGEDENDDENFMYSEDDEEIRFNRNDLGSEGLRSSINNVGRRSLGKVKIRSGMPSEDPWDKEAFLITYLPLMGSVAVSGLAFFVVRFVVSDKY